MYSLIPSKAPNAPATQAPPQIAHRTAINIGCAVALVLMIVVGGIVGVVLSANHPGYTSIRTVDRSDACSMSQDFVKDNLKAPTTAQFPMWTEDNCKTSHNGDHWTVYSYVDSQNGFGAMIRSEYVAEMTYSPGRDNWTLTNIAISSR